MSLWSKVAVDLHHVPANEDNAPETSISEVSQFKTRTLIRCVRDKPVSVSLCSL